MNLSSIKRIWTLIKKFQSSGFNRLSVCIAKRKKKSVKNVS